MFRINILQPEISIGNMFKTILALLTKYKNDKITLFKPHLFICAYSEHVLLLYLLENCEI